MRRRTAIATAGAALAGLSAGCLDSFRREDAWRELVVDPPDGVYVPPHADGMVRYGTTTADGREISLLASRPHSFWLVSGDDRDRADIRSRHDVHLMVTVRDAETDAFVPAPIATAIRTRDGARTGASGRVDERTLWPMLSQRMGPHYGDNVSLEGDGAYTATVRVGATSAAVTDGAGTAAARGLEDETRVELQFAYDAAEIEALERRLIDEDEGRGESDALEPMAHAVSGTDGPNLETAEPLGTAIGDDIEYTAVLVDDEGPGRDASTDSTLAVLAQTPYNSFPLPFASLSAAVTGDRDRDDAELASGSLRETVDPRLGHCYLTRVDPAVLEAGDELRIRLETPPQVARHEGYETAFLEAESVSMTLETR